MAVADEGVSFSSPSFSPELMMEEEVEEVATPRRRRDSREEEMVRLALERQISEAKVKARKLGTL